MITVTAPHTGEVLGEVPERTPEELDRAMERARHAAVGWAGQGFEGRAVVMRRVRDALLAERSRLVEVMCAETGKVRGDAVLEVTSTFDTLHYYLSQGAKHLADEVVTPLLLKHKRGYVAFHPLGVVGIISPWNFPLDLSFGEVIPALLAGNAVLLKPSELTPLIALEVQRIAVGAGLDPGLFQVMTGAGETGAALVERVDAITFTGSAAVGRKVAATASRRLIPFTLELGGKDPMIVMRDADLDRAASGAVWGAFFNCGQMCMSVERVYVEEAVADDFINRVVQRTEKLRQGPQHARNGDVGAMTRLAQIDVVTQHVSDARERGARILTGGDVVPGKTRAYYQPTVLTGVDHSMEIMQDETFGPVLPIMRVRDVDEAVRLANDSPYGLNASVWSKDVPAARRVARQIRSGNVCVNDVVVSYSIPELPFGGVKESGLGRRHGPGGIRKYTSQQTIAEDRLGFKREPYWYPYSERILAITERATDLFGGLKGLLGRR